MNKLSIVFLIIIILLVTLITLSIKTTVNISLNCLEFERDAEERYKTLNEAGLMFEPQGDGSYKLVEIPKDTE